MYEIIALGCSMYKCETFNEAFAKYLETAKKYGLDNVDFKHKGNDVTTINLIIKKEN
ncbi:MAG: hypothetical protein IJ410_02595 [Oscillospiraceae bacterium]|nr:hypothetical protein [Oscillospiraceae bacterium]